MSSPSKAPPADLVAGLQAPLNCKALPCRFLYDEAGSKLYDQITRLPEYYPFATERRLLQQHAADIVRHIPRGAVVVELGVGAAEKTRLLLGALLDRDGPEGVRFCGIDCSAEALDQARANLQRACPRLRPSQVALLQADYLAGVALARQAHPDATLCLLWLGSSVGNFSQDAAAVFLRDLATAAGERMQLLLCTDLWKDEGTLQRAYCDSAGVTEAFIKNGMRHVLRVLGQPDDAADPTLWEYEAVVNGELQQVEMWLVSKAGVPGVLPGVAVGPGERVLMEVSRKFTRPAIAQLAHRAGLCMQATWGDAAYQATLLLPPREALLRCWADTDALFSGIRDWRVQPIPLRHPFLFYYGHTAAFARLKMLPSEPDTSLDITLSRGIDPNVADPTKCHPHPDVPSIWPSKRRLLEYVAQVRSKLLTSLGGSTDALDMRALCMSLEHERMHQETLCYMLAQQRKREFLSQQLEGRGQPPSSPGGAALGPLTPGAPRLRILSEDGRQLGGGEVPAVEPFYLGQCSYLHHSYPKGSSSRSLEFVRVPGSRVLLGLGSAGCQFVWDNEVGEAAADVGPFMLATRPVTVAEFLEFVLRDKGYERPELWDADNLRCLARSGAAMPATWSQGPNDALFVHMPEATYSWEQVADCPAYVSLAEAQAYCRLHGGRVMSEGEHLAACQHAEAAGGAAAVAGLNEGGWEWTASELAPFPGFSPDPLYPEYTTDFLDGCHCVLRGSSPYTHPSVRRDTFRNFFQRAYPYAFCKFRLARATAGSEGNSGRARGGMS